MVNTVKELFQIQTDTVAITLVCIFLHLMQCIVSTTMRAEAEAVVTELRFVKRYQHLADCLLNKAVYHCRDT